MISIITLKCRIFGTTSPKRTSSLRFLVDEFTTGMMHVRSINLLLLTLSLLCEHAESLFAAKFSRNTPISRKVPSTTVWSSGIIQPEAIDPYAKVVGNFNYKSPQPKGPGTYRWLANSGNYILRPAANVKPLGVIHFLGGAFVGAAPHLTYTYLLNLLVLQGYIVVATPYRLNLDYITVCGEVVSKFDSVARELATEFGPLTAVVRSYIHT